MNCLYLHIPFCRRKCLYCSFNSHPGQEHLHERYGRALLKEIGALGRRRPLDSLFIGGGTPTVLETGLLAELLERCADQFGLSEAAEISIEANPESVDAAMLSDLRRAGFNRISLGVQSFEDSELKTLGRIHSAAAAHAAVSAAFRAGFSNVSIDLMCGLPGQQVGSWRRTLDRALELGPRHLSVYQLSIEEGTGFFRLAGAGRLALPAEEAVLDMDEATIDMCRAAGLHRYEISNFARPGYACRHNLNYWRNESYLACGAGAVSYLDGVRESRIANPKTYCRLVEQGEEIIAEREKLARREAFKETVVMGLRLTDGVSQRRLRQRFGLRLIDVYTTELDKLTAQRLISFDGSRLALTGRGMRFANQVMAELV